MTEFPRLFEPGNIGSMVVPNRLVFPAIGTYSADPDSQMNDRTIAYYVARAKGGAGLIITMGLKADAHFAHLASSCDDSFIPSLKRLTDSIHRYNTRIVGQVNHGGVKDYFILDGMKREERPEILGPSAVRCVTYGVTPRPLTKEEIRQRVERWSDACLRVKKAGFDGVEIFGAHGYFLGNFLSAYQNRRTDEYGGSLENRARFACEIISRTRDKVGPDFPVMFRMNGCDFIEGGTTIEEAAGAAPFLVKAGADAVDISAGTQETRQWRDLSYLLPDAAIIYLAAAVKKAVKVPVIGVGKIGDPVLAESILEEGKADFVAMARALMVDPELPNKAREGRLDDIRHCIYCNNCRLGHGKKWLIDAKGAGLSCTVNAALLREKEFEIRPAARPRKVMVVGGGLAGMEAARTLAARGHRVTLYEQNDKLGGQWNIASQVPLKGPFSSVTRWLNRDIERAGVRVVLNTKVDKTLVAREKPDVVVVAAGSLPALPDVEGLDNEKVVQAIDVIQRKVKVGKEVVVIGGAQMAMEVADMLAGEGHRVTIAARTILGRGVERNTLVVLRDRLLDKGVTVLTSSPPLEVRGKGVYIAWEKELKFVPADTVILATGMKPENGLVEALKGVVPETYSIGDCVKPGNALDAIDQGAVIARKI